MNNLDISFLILFFALEHSFITQLKHMTCKCIILIKTTDSNNTGNSIFEYFYTLYCTETLEIQSDCLDKFYIVVKSKKIMGKLLSADIWHRNL